MDLHQTLVEFSLNHMIEGHLVEEKTAKMYMADLAHFCDFLEEGQIAPHIDTLIMRVERSVIEKYLKGLEETRYATATIARRMSALRNLYRWLMSTGRISSNPMLGLKTPKRETKVRPTISDEQIRKLLEAPNRSILGARDRALFQIMLSTGARASELLELARKDFETGNGLGLPSLCLKRRARVFLEGEAREAFTAYINLLPKLQTDSTPLFANKHGERLSSRSLRRKIEKYLKVAGIDEDINPRQISLHLHPRKHRALKDERCDQSLVTV